ncbi:Spy/CpxP family protein refolding chaperone [Sedimenticola selenatireducens]|uniref:Spy/CpxP family protein refolding chaperone n=1 Tax=Sedimenticola selenatireducens TaxID=191960 RepID=UPI0006880878|nr:Spy/CpxP family protein refolding chaperone [Sedimenticola selenatireducens]
MKQKTKRDLSIVAVSMLAIGVTGVVLAQGGFGPGSGPGWGGHQAMMGSPGGMHNPGGMMGGPRGMHNPGGMMGGPGGMYNPGAGRGGMMGGDPVAFTDQRLTELKSALGVTGEQEKAWNTYADALKGQADMMMSHRQLMFGGEQITAEQRFAFHQQGLDQMQKIATASRDLYSTLTPEQQAKAGNLIGMHHAMR